jgi:hypothetical protein
VTILSPSGRVASLFGGTLLALLFTGCITATTATWRESRENQARINQVKMGQSLDEVRAIMQRQPSRREARLRFDGQTVEEWSYVTDLVRKRDATITFVSGHVVEIRTKPFVDPD